MMLTEPNGEYQNLLKEVEVPVVPNAACQTMLRKTRLGNFFQLHDSFICAGGELGKDACKVRTIPRFGRFLF